MSEHVNIDQDAATPIDGDATIPPDGASKTAKPPLRAAHAIKRTGGAQTAASTQNASARCWRE